MIENNNEVNNELEAKQDDEKKLNPEVQAIADQIKSLNGDYSKLSELKSWLNDYVQSLGATLRKQMNDEARERKEYYQGLQKTLGVNIFPTKSSKPDYYHPDGEQVGKKSGKAKAWVVEWDKEFPNYPHTKLTKEEFDSKKAIRDEQEGLTWQEQYRHLNANNVPHDEESDTNPIGHPPVSE